VGVLLSESIGREFGETGEEVSNVLFGGRGSRRLSPCGRFRVARPAGRHSSKAMRGIFSFNRRRESSLVLSIALSVALSCELTDVSSEDGICFSATTREEAWSADMPQ
jgi:hypothetical protein